MKTSDITLVFQGAFKPYVTRERDAFLRNIRLTRQVLPGARMLGPLLRGMCPMCYEHNSHQSLGLPVYIAEANHCAVEKTRGWVKPAMQAAGGNLGFRV